MVGVLFSEMKFMTVVEFCFSSEKDMTALDRMTVHKIETNVLVVLAPVIGVAE